MFCMGYRRFYPNSIWSLLSIQLWRFFGDARRGLPLVSSLNTFVSFGWALYHCTAKHFEIIWGFLFCDVMWARVQLFEGNMLKLVKSTFLASDVWDFSEKPSVLGSVTVGNKRQGVAGDIDLVFAWAIENIWSIFCSSARRKGCLCVFPLLLVDVICLFGCFIGFIVAITVWNVLL